MNEDLAPLLFSVEDTWSLIVAVSMNEQQPLGTRSHLHAVFLLASVRRQRVDKLLDEVALGDVLLRKPFSPIQWARTASNLMFAYCGHQFEVEAVQRCGEAVLIAVDEPRGSVPSELSRPAQVPDADRRPADAVVDALLASNSLDIAEDA
jgi:hypothetical protein